MTIGNIQVGFERRLKGFCSDHRQDVLHGHFLVFLEEPGKSVMTEKLVIRDELIIDS